jgi:GntR family transcriptional regulator / MocR family aminotransferase
LRWEARRAITAAPSNEFGYPDPCGLPGLREALTSYLARVRGVRTSPDHIIVCSGFVQALNLLSTALHRGGADIMAVESHGFGMHRDVIRAAGMATRPLPVDSAGARIDELARAPADAVLLTPAHQFPLGVPLAAQRRSAVLQCARDRGTLIIEDDYDGEFRYDRRPLGGLQGHDPDLVAYAGTASKSLAPGLGLAWLVLPPRLVEALAETKRLSDGHTGIVEQLTLAEFIRSGAYDRHIRRSRLRYRRRRDRLLALLAERSPDVTVTGIAAGLHAVLELGRGLRAADEAGIVSRAARAGLTVQGLSDYRYDPGSGHGHGAALVVGYGTPPDHAFAGALDTLCDVLG